MNVNYAQPSVGISQTLSVQFTDRCIRLVDFISCELCSFYGAPGQVSLYRAIKLLEKQAKEDIAQETWE